MPWIVQVEAKLPIGTYNPYLLTYQQILRDNRQMTIERLLLTAYCTHPVPLRLTFAPLRFFNTGCALDNLAALQGISRGLRSRLLPQYHSLKKSVILAAAKELILKLIW